MPIVMDGCRALLAGLSSPLVRCAACCLRRRGHRALPSQPGVSAVPIRETSEEELHSFFSELREGAKDFAEYTWRARADLARECLTSMLEVHDEIAAAGGAHKGTAETGLGEELLAFGGTFSTLRQFAEGLDKEGKPPLLGVRNISDAKVAVRAFPSSLYEHLLFPGWRGEVWVKAGPDGPSQGTRIRQRVQEKTAPVCVQLAAGNQASVVTCDVIEKVFGEGCACLVKMNTVNEYLGPILERGFSPLVQRKLLHFAYGPVAVASQCINNPAADELHMTGSDRTYNIIQWGAPDGPREASEVPKVSKPFTAELGACTPYIMCPGQWSEAKLRECARSIVSMKIHNAGCNCLSPQILITSSSWTQRDRFLEFIRQEFKGAQARQAWYPGAADRLRKVMTDNPSVEFFPAPNSTDSFGLPLLPKDSTEFMPWIFLPNAPISPKPLFFREEFFAGALVEVALESAGPEEFLRVAVDFANNSLWGTLSCALFAPPSVPQIHIEDAVAELRYGSVNVNTVTATGYFLSPCTWGGYAGHKPEDIQSGTGVVHNTLFLDNVEKSVMWAPFRSLPYTPFWYYTHANAENLGRRTGYFFAYAGFCQFVKVAFSGLRG